MPVIPRSPKRAQQVKDEVGSFGSRGRRFLSRLGIFDGEHARQLFFGGAILLRVLFLAESEGCAELLDQRALFPGLSLEVGRAHVPEFSGRSVTHEWAMRVTTRVLIGSLYPAKWSASRAASSGNPSISNSMVP